MIKPPSPTKCIRAAVMLCCLLWIGGTTATWGQAGGRFGRWRVDVTVTPKRLYADGKRSATIRIELRDPQGAHAPDGTVVVFSTNVGGLSLGEVDKRPSLSAETRGGFATVFISSEEPGTARVRVQAADSFNFAYVEFVPEGEPLGTTTRVIEIRGGWVGYSLDLDTIEARDCATARYGRLTVEAEGILQVNIGTMVLKAALTAAFERGDKRLEGADAYWDIQSNQAAMRRITDEGVQVLYFDTLGLKPRPESWQLPDDAFRLDKRATESWLVCKSALIFIGEKIVLRHAALYVQGQKVFTLPPYWIIALPGYSGSSNTQTLGLTSSGGLGVDFPWYYRVTNSATGAIKIQRGVTAGSIIARDGWSLAVEEEYRKGDIQSRITVSGLPHDDWGIQIEDQRTLWGSALSNLSIAWPDHRSLFVDANLFDNWANGWLSVRGYYNAAEGVDASYGAAAQWLSNPHPLLRRRAATYRLGTSIALRGGPGYNGTVLENQLYGALDLRPWQLGSKTTLRPSLTNLYTWDTDGFRANNISGRLWLKHNFSDSMWGNLSYNAEYTSGDAFYTGWRQVLGLDVQAQHGGKWDAYLNSSYDLTEKNTSAYLYSNYYLNRLWRIGLLGTYYDFSNTSYNDIELELGRSIFNREIALRYSFETGRLTLELAGLVGTRY